MRHALQLNDAEHELWLARLPGGGYRLHALGRDIAVSLELGADGAGALRVDGRSLPVVIVGQGDELFVHIDGANHAVRLRHPLERASGEAQTGADDRVRAPMPGTALSVAVRAGDRVARGATLMVMESMKLETTLSAPRDAMVQAVHVSAGQSFERDAVLVTLADAPAP
jgi:acetyl/propionyl-CoA carboxylase alpha subunit